MYRLKFLFTGRFWDAFLYVSKCKILGYPKWFYAWYSARLKLIIRGKI